MRPSKKIRKKYNTDYRDASVFASRARLLQSIWRKENNYEFEKYGNYLLEEFSVESGANFLTNNIFEIVKREVEDKKIAGKVIQEPRIWNNLLSSQPLAFNLFGELKLNTPLATSVFNELFPDKNIYRVTNIDFEYSPGRNVPKYTSDKSAFDVFVEYSNHNDKKSFFGIEVKYSENLDNSPASHKERYEEISEQSEVFNMSCLPKLKGKPLQQIWRDHLLALSLSQDYDDCGEFIYLYPRDNTECSDAINDYMKTFNKASNSCFIPLTMEKVIKVIKSYCNENWVFEFENRYLDFSKVDKLIN